MTRHSSILAAASAFLLAMNICTAATPPSLSPAAKAFEKECLSAHKNCIYKNVRFESANRKAMFTKRSKTRRISTRTMD